MRRVLIVMLASGLTGCNLFEPVQTSSDGRDAGTDAVAVSDVSDVTQPPPRDMQPGDTVVIEDDGTSEDQPCIPETDAELCAAIGATCGELLVPTADATLTRYEAEDIIAPTATCSQARDDIVSMCSSNTYLETVHTFAAGLYRVRVYGKNDTPSLLEARIDIAVDAEDVSSLWLRDAEEYAQIERDIDFAAGEHTVRFTFSNDAFDPSLGDLNARIDWVEFEGPLGPPRDRCGDERRVSCGTCDAEQGCGVLRANVCDCRCPLGDGCAAVGPHPDDPCLQCTDTGWDGTSARCASDGDACTDDVCHSGLGVCEHEAVTCPDPGDCQVAVCDSTTGSCDTSTAPDGTSCGVMGVCAAGVCGCDDGTTVEMQCGDGMDNDCDGDVDCDDVDCEGRGCGMGMFCTGGVCS
jgi:hypothetical protein